MVIGGINQSSRLGNIFEYDIKQRQWRLMPVNKNRSLFKARYGHSAVLTYDKEQVILFGGSEDMKMNDVIAYDLRSGNFTKINSGEADGAPSQRDF